MAITKCEFYRSTGSNPFTVRAQFSTIIAYPDLGWKNYAFYKNGVLFAGPGKIMGYFGNTGVGGALITLCNAEEPFTLTIVESDP